MFIGVRRKVNERISGTFRVGMPKFLGPGSILTTFGTRMPNASDGNGICHDDRAVAITDSPTNERSVSAEAVRIFQIKWTWRLPGR
jgi:hypothetical protein